MSLYHLMYVSRAVDAISDRDLRQIQDAALRRNREQDVTGVLLYSSGYFIQLLEGPLDSVTNLFERLAQDPRHDGLERIYLEEVSGRLFSEWSMGVFNLDEHATTLHIEELRECMARNSQDTDSDRYARILHTFNQFRSQLGPSNQKAAFIGELLQ